MIFHIVIPTYNRKSLLKRALDSIYNQDTKVKYLVYIIDDGSTDWTYDFIINNYKENNIFYFYQKNWWVSSARNFWIDKVLEKWNQDDFLLFLDSDDELLTGALNNIYDFVNKYNNISYFAFWVKNQLWNQNFYNKEDNQILSYKDSLSEIKAFGEFFRVIKLNIFFGNNFFFPDWLNWWEFLFRLEINKKENLLVSNKIVRLYYQDDIWITRDLLNKTKVMNFLKVTKLFIDNYWEDLFNLNKKLLGLHYLVYARMLALSWSKLISLRLGFKGFIYSWDFPRLILYIVSLLPYWIIFNNTLLKIKK